MIILRHLYYVSSKYRLSSCVYIMSSNGCRTDRFHLSFRLISCIYNNRNVMNIYSFNCYFNETFEENLSIDNRLTFIALIYIYICNLINTDI